MSEPHKDIVIIGTLDTKGVEISFLASQLQSLNLTTKIIDVGIGSTPQIQADIGRDVVASKTASDIARILIHTEGKLKAMDAMARGAIGVLEELIESDEVSGVMALGGGVGTWIGMKILRSLPFGLPKIMISTLPFDIRSSMGAKDIMIIPSVTDILGLNPILRKVLQNAAGAMVGMAQLSELSATSAQVVAVTALGVTTPLANSCKYILEAEGYEVATFHGVGVGGKIFEEWVQTGLFTGVLDLTPHDINNFLFDGITPFYSGRLESAADKNIPQVIAPGGLDFISKGPLDTLSQEERQRKHYQHSPMFTHVRVNSAEMEEVARELAIKLNRGSGTTQVAIPLRGFSFQGHAKGYLADHQSDMSFVRVLKQKLQPVIPVVEVDAHINDESFAKVVCTLLLQMINSNQT
ncbi:MAG: Tm-1-like ATP-binding domain-containing protein [Desulfobacterales bacterium]|nr:Tm-1-like ATP-binding domain-containing protein [Desulfobacterales bacterium]